MSLANIAHTIGIFLPLFITALAVLATLTTAHILLIRRNQDLGSERMFPRQLMMLGLTVLGVIALVFALPIADSSRNQIIGLIGLVISGVFAFSSTNIFGNLAAGLLLRVTTPFKVGDFISVGNHFGRVAQRGLFDTEVQSDTGELIALPNTYVISTPVSTVRRDVTIVSATLSLGYDLHHGVIEPLLIEAAENCGLQEPFVHILELGNYAISYRVSGILPEAKGLLTARSNLHRQLLDVLHGNGVEIVSPDYTNQRRMTLADQAIPERSGPASPKDAGAAEDILFDKAEQAAQLEEEKAALLKDVSRLETRLKETRGDEKKRLKTALEDAQTRLKTLADNTLADNAGEPEESRDETPAVAEKGSR